MNILYLALDSTQYQSRSHEIMVAEELAKVGNKVHLVCERMPYGYDTEGIPKNISLDIMPINSELNWDHLDKLMERKYDITFSSSFPGAKYAIKIANKQGIKSVCQILDVPIFRLPFDHWNKVWRENVKVLEEADVIIGNIKITEELLIKLSEGRLKGKIETIYYGINTEQADSVEPFKSDVPYMVWVSGIRWYKSLETILLAMKCMKNPPKLKVIGVGDGSEQEVNNGIPFRILQMAIHFGLDVEFLGGVTDLEKYSIIKGARLGVMNDLSQSIATMFVIECVYSGVHCISSNFDVCKDRYVILPTYVDNPYDTGEWARVMEECFTPEWQQHHLQFVEPTKEWIRENRSFKSQAKKLLEVFEKWI